MLETLKNLDHAVESLRNIIRAKGADYVYEQIDNGCRYTLPIEGFSFEYDEYDERIEGDLPPTEQIVGSCVMGVLAISLDPNAAPLLFIADEEGGESISNALYHKFGWDYNDDYSTVEGWAATEQKKVVELFANMQREQDQGASWGVAFHRAIMDLNRVYGTNYNPDVNSVSIYKED